MNEEVSLFVDNLFLGFLKKYDLVMQQSFGKPNFKAKYQSQIFGFDLVNFLEIWI
jgi:hypothetical protein